MKTEENIRVMLVIERGRLLYAKTEEEIEIIENRIDILNWVLNSQIGK